MELKNVRVYRMTHIGNVPHVLEHGITHKNSHNANPDFINIGDISLIETRSKKRIIVDNGEYLKFGAQTIILGNFIPFYFGVRMPMLYVMQNGGNFVERATPAKDIVYLVCSVDHFIQAEYTCYFSDGHATDHYTTFYDMTQIIELPNLVDWDAVKTAYWGGQENLDIKRKKQAEFLVSGDIPPEYIIGFGCFNETAKTKLQALGIEGGKIKVIPNAYF
jgi:hypothetical protein